MSNVFQFVGKTKTANPSNPNTGVTIAVADILASSANLGCAIEKLSMCFDAFDRIIDAVGDTETRNRHKQSMKLNREILMYAANRWVQNVCKLSWLQNTATLEKIG